MQPYLPRIGRCILKIPSEEEISAAFLEAKQWTADEIRSKWRQEQMYSLERTQYALNSSWRCKQIKEVQQASLTFNVGHSVSDLDAEILACFGNLNSEAHEIRTKRTNSELSGTDTDYEASQSFLSEGHTHMPRMSGFLVKRSQGLSPSVLLRGWQERWFVLSPHRCGAQLQYFKRDLYSSPAKSIILTCSSRVLRDPGLDTQDRFCFSFNEHGSAKRRVLAASNEAQALAWISCINGLLSEGISFTRAAST